MDSPSEIKQLELRLQAIEQKITLSPSATFQSDSPRAWWLLWQALGVALAQQGLGSPHHPYQWGFALLCSGFFFQKHALIWPKKVLTYGLLFLNYLAFAFLSQLIIGSGRHYPFRWWHYPTLTWQRSGVFSEPVLSWVPVSWANTEFDLTLFQSLLLALFVFGRWLRIPGFTSLMAVLLVLASLPTFASVRWDWAFPALAILATGFHWQAQSTAPKKTP